MQAFAYNKRHDLPLAQPNHPRLGFDSPWLRRKLTNTDSIKPKFTLTCDAASFSEAVMSMILEGMPQATELQKLHEMVEKVDDACQEAQEKASGGMFQTYPIFL